jgi:DNA-binding transcriptional ArsR family regulator
MPSELRAATTLDTRVRVALSAPQDLAFALFGVLSGHAKMGHTPAAWLRTLLEEYPSLHERIQTFWDPAETATSPEWGELLVVAWRQGTLFDEDMGRFFERFEATVREPIAVPALPSEEDGVREIIQSRLDRLQASSELRGRYLALVRDFWESLKPFWDGGAHTAALKAANELRRNLRNETDLGAVLPAASFVRREQFVPLIEAALSRGEVALIPLALAGEGNSLFSLPGATLVGHGLEVGLIDERRRRVTEQAAARFKALSDPTRLAILLYLFCGPASMTDVALRFEVSQPTVSVHMKTLREAGLVEAEKAGNLTLYRSDERRVRSYVDEACGSLVSS